MFVPPPTGLLLFTSLFVLVAADTAFMCRQVVNFPADVHDQILKMASINLCPNVSGQICCTLMMTPPEPGQPSHELYVQVKATTHKLRSCAMTVVGVLG